MPASSARPIVAVLCSAESGKPPHLEPVESRADVRYTDATGLAEALDGAQALFLWDFFSSAVRDVWQQAQHLEWIHVAAAGVDTLMFDELAQSDVVVTNAKGVFDRPIAEFVLASILALRRTSTAATTSRPAAPGSTARRRPSRGPRCSWSGRAPSAARSPACCAWSA